MTAVGAWLAVVGLCDLVRAGRDATPRVRRWLLTFAGALLLVAAAIWLSAPWWLAIIWVVTFALWLQASAAALADRAPADRAWVPRAVAFTALAVGPAAGLVAAATVPEPSWGLSGPLGELPAELALVAAGTLLCQLATANVLVRLLLDAVGVPASDNEKTLRGGRLLGPMERLMVVGLGLAGELTAAGIVVAAKGLLRFPELQRGARSGPSDMTEYFLIGSFASWLLALAGVALVGWA